MVVVEIACGHLPEVAEESYPLLMAVVQGLNMQNATHPFARPEVHGLVRQPQLAAGSVVLFESFGGYHLSSCLFSPQTHSPVARYRALR